ncbi:hypothetical protein FQR65_LT13352 [Abscondita terminalis]|nr:hypothetical protein FQR65_LT13352 [Abscondita terminalis]
MLVVICLSWLLLSVSGQSEEFQHIIDTIKVCTRDENINLVDLVAIMREFKSRRSNDLLQLIKCCMRHFGKGYALNEISYEDLKNVNIPGVPYELRSTIIDSCREKTVGVWDESFDYFAKCCMQELKNFVSRVK